MAYRWHWLAKKKTETAQGCSSDWNDQNGPLWLWACDHDSTASGRWLLPTSSVILRWNTHNKTGGFLGPACEACFRPDVCGGRLILSFHRPWHSASAVWRKLTAGLQCDVWHHKPHRRLACSFCLLEYCTGLRSASIAFWSRSVGPRRNRSSSMRSTGAFK